MVKALPAALSPTRVTSGGSDARRVSGHDAKEERLSGASSGARPTAHWLGARFALRVKPDETKHSRPLESGRASANCAGPQKEPTTVR